MATITLAAHHRTAYTACAVYEYLYTQGAGKWPTWLTDMHDDIGAPPTRDFIITELADYLNNAFFFATSLQYGGSLDYDFIPDALTLTHQWPYFHKMNARELGVAVAELDKTRGAYMQNIPF